MRHVNPDISNGQALSLQELHTSELENLFLPTALEEEEVFMASSSPLVSPAVVGKAVDEVLELDQGVAMEVSADHHTFITNNHVYELPLSSPNPSVSLNVNIITTASSESLCSPYQLVSPASHHSFTYPQTADMQPIPVSVHLPEQFVAVADLPQPAPQPIIPVHATRQDSELDLIFTVLGEDMATTSSTHQRDLLPSTASDTFSSASPLQLEDVRKLVMDSSPLSVPSGDGSFVDSKTDFDSSSLSGSLPSPIQWTNGGNATSKWRESRASQTERREISRHSRSWTPEELESSSECSPAPSSRQPMSVSSNNGTSEKEQLVHMPFYDFKKILDSSSVTERDKEEVKNIRRRGKNKLAAKVCRQRKMELISALQREVDKLKGEREELLQRTNSEQRKILWYKRRCVELLSQQKTASPVAS